MKIKKSLTPLLLLIICMLVFSACSNGAKFNFDENSAVKLTYTCADEEKSFDAELNAEQSHNLILSLNKITYVEVKEHIDFGPSFDCLRIDIGDDNLDLYDVGYKIKYGGYFYYNGTFCESKEKFGFLEPYLSEYLPDVILNSVSFGVQYVKQTVGEEENYQIIKNTNELNNYIETEMRNIDLPIVLFKDEVIDKYDDEFFENSFIVIFMKAASSGSFDFRVNDVQASRYRLIVHYEIYLPGGYKDGEMVAVTDDMAYWYSFVELSNEYNTIQNVDLVSVN